MIDATDARISIINPKLRLETARAYVKMISDGHSPAASSTSSARDGKPTGAVGLGGNISTSLRLTASVFGIGPLFRLSVFLHNTGKHPMVALPIAFFFDQELYCMEGTIGAKAGDKALAVGPTSVRKSNPVFTVPLLLPGVEVSCKTKHVLLSVPNYIEIDSMQTCLACS